jgi:hypothetical protein
VQNLAHDDHRADKQRHDRIDEGFVATVHLEANLSPSSSADVPQRR